MSDKICKAAKTCTILYGKLQHVPCFVMERHSNSSCMSAAARWRQRKPCAAQTRHETASKHRLWLRAEVPLTLWLQCWCCHHLQSACRTTLTSNKKITAVPSGHSLNWRHVLSSRRISSIWSLVTLSSLAAFANSWSKSWPSCEAAVPVESSLLQVWEVIRVFELDGECAIAVPVKIRPVFLCTSVRLRSHVGFLFLFVWFFFLEWNCSQLRFELP